VVGCEAFQVVVVGQRVNENRPRDIRAVGQQALEVLRIKFLGECGLFGGAGDVVQYRGHIGLLLEACGEFPPNDIRAQIDVVQMDS
jgi:hypothetical protein